MTIWRRLLGPAGEAPQSRILAIALGLLLAPVTALAASSLVFLLGGRLSPPLAALILILSAAVGLGVAYRLARSWIAPATVALVVLGSAAVSHVFLDTTFDGQQYHYDATLALATGWSPVWEDYVPAAAIAEVTSDWPWAGHYPQAAWRIAALQLAVGVDAETTKWLAIVFGAALFFAAWELAQKLGAGPRASVALALAAAANPILIQQAFTRMNDGLLGTAMALAGVFAALWFRNRSPWALLGFVLPLVFGLNLKFTAVPLFVALCVLIAGLGWLAAGRAAAFRFAGAALAAGVLGVLVIGAHPYVTNTVQHHHPFHPVMGPEQVDILSYNYPPALRDLGAAERILFAHLSPTSTGYDGAAGLKIPFTVQRVEIRAAGTPDPRLGGFGPLFSGAVLLALVLAGIAAWREGWRPLTIPLAAAAGLVAIALAMPEAWWARYVAYVWPAPVLVAGALAVRSSLRLRHGGLALVGVLLLNAAFVTAATLKTAVEETSSVNRQIAEIAALPGPVPAFFGESHARIVLLRKAGANIAPSPAPVPAGCAIDLIETWSVDQNPPFPAYCPAEP